MQTNTSGGQECKFYFDSCKTQFDPTCAAKLPFFCFRCMTWNLSHVSHLLAYIRKWCKMMMKPSSATFPLTLLHLWSYPDFPSIHFLGNPHFRTKSSNSWGKMLKALENSSVVKKRRLQWENFCVQMSVQTDPKPGLEYFANTIVFFSSFFSTSSFETKTRRLNFNSLTW